jgi:ankyrin repeat protein
LASCSDKLADVVETLLRHGANPAAANVGGFMPLHIAARDGAHNVAHALIEAGAPIDALVPTTEMSPLHIAALSGHAPVVAVLLRAGARADMLTGTVEERPIASHQTAADIADLVDEPEVAALLREWDDWHRAPSWARSPRPDDGATFGT